MQGRSERGHRLTRDASLPSPPWRPARSWRGIGRWPESRQCRLTRFHQVANLDALSQLAKIGLVTTAKRPPVPIEENLHGPLYPGVFLGRNVLDRITIMAGEMMGQIMETTAVIITVLLTAFKPSRGLSTRLEFASAACSLPTSQLSFRVVVEIRVDEGKVQSD